MAQPSYPWTEYQHELGGARVYYITKKYWETTVKRYLEDYIKTKLIRPVPPEIEERNKELIIPEEPLV